MKFYSALLTACLASLTGATPTPLTDVGSTSVKVNSVAGNPNQFVVDVTRTDVLIEDGETLAERVMTVDLVFDVDDNNLRVNGQSVSALGEGPKASIVKATFVRGDIQDPEKMENYFSEGLINVEVASEVENFLVVNEADPTAQPVLGRHITIHEKILEVDGNKARQSSISEHVIDVYSNGTIVRSASNPSLDSQKTVEATSDAEVSPCGSSQSFAQFADGSNWSEEDLNTAALYGFSVAFSLAFIYFIVALVRRRRQNGAYAPISTGDCPPGYNAKDAAIFSSELKSSSEVTEVAEVDENITVLESLTSNQD